MHHWIHAAVNYQINLRALAAREPRNPFEATEETPLADSALAYSTRRLPALKKLGVTILHLMPPFSIGIEGRKGIGSPYAVRDFRTVDAEYGTTDELAALVRAAHELGLKVILGMVPNHTSRDHVWVQEHPEFYVRNGDGSIAYDADWHDTAKLDYRTPGLRRAMLDLYDYWLSFLGEGSGGHPDGVDGFRIDMAHLINDLGFWNEALEELKSKHASRELLFLAECYGMKHNLDLFQRGMNAAYDDDFYKIMLYFYGVDDSGNTLLLPNRKHAQRNDLFRDIYAAFKRGGLAGAAEKALMNYEEHLPGTERDPILARYTDNHDEGRGLYRFGEGAVKAMNRLLFFSAHCLPFLLAGQEFGALNRPPIHERIQPCEKGCRIRTNAKVKTRDGVEFEGNLFARTYEKRREWYAFYQDLIAVRCANPALTHGTFRPLDVGEASAASRRTVVGFTRVYEGQTLHGAVNIGPEPRRLRRVSGLTGKPLYGALNGDILQPFEAVLVQRA